MQKFYDQFEACGDHDLPYCADACPLKMDVTALRDKLAKNKYNTAYKTLRNAVVFPDIVAAICPAYCEKSCIRAVFDEPVRIAMLEKTIVAKATRKKPNEYNLPPKKEKVAVIGAGLAGMAFAFKMASKKYDVTIYEKSDKIGGKLWDMIPSDIFLNDFELQFQFEKYTLELNTEITDISVPAAEGYKVIYIATGQGGNDFGLPEKIGDAAVLAGGSLLDMEPVAGLAQSINLSRIAENYLKTGVLETPADIEPSHMVVTSTPQEKTPAVIATDSDGTFTDEEASAEASRCIDCRCDACINSCDLIKFYDKMPVKMRDEIFLSVKPAGSLVHKAPARKYIAACTMCGLMTESCPENIDLCGMIKLARYKMHQADKMPAAYRQYYMRDMEFANGEFAAIRKLPPAPSGDNTGYAFFPGCQLGASNPDYVLKPYKWLLSKDPNIGMLLRCCSVPVDWNGENERHLQEIAELKKDWEDLGKPTLIMACMSCQKHLSQYLPEIPTISLYEFMVSQGFEKSTDAKAQPNDMPKVHAVFDPCSARNRESVQKAVRNLAAAAGLETEDLPKGDKHGCCGFGGMGDIAAPDFAEHVTKSRIEISDLPYLVYCSNCHDIFTDKGKTAAHILDILFDIDPLCTLPQPTVTERNANRVMLKERLLEEIWGEKMTSKPEEKSYVLFMSDDIRKKINKQKLTEDDICQVIDRAEETGRKTINPENGHYKAYNEIGHITCWVEYTPADGGYEIHNVYSHRMRIDLEVVFNGRKVDM